MPNLSIDTVAHTCERLKLRSVFVAQPRSRGAVQTDLRVSP
jgi:hypothetical protein